MRTYTAIFSLLLGSALQLGAQNFVNGQAARAVFGQYTFTFGGATPGTTQTLPNRQILGGASGLAWANGILYVADSNHLGAIPQDNRVMMFNTSLLPAANADLTNAKSYSTYQCNVCAFPAFNQLGQPAQQATQQGTSDNPNAFNAGLSNDANQSNMRTPTAVATDGNILAVADTDNNRVLIWNSIPTSWNQPANVVLGQPNFTTATPVSPPTAQSLLGPQGVWIQNGKLYVADTQNYRVLIWNHIPTTNGAPADVVLGQQNMSSGTQSACDPTKSNTGFTATASILCNPVSVTADASHIFVSDLGFNRVLIWNTTTPGTGQAAAVVVGQPDMASTAANNPKVCVHTGQNVTCEANLNFPQFALSDGTRLFVADTGNDRVLVFNTIPTTNGVPANEVLGEPNFLTDNVSSLSAGIASTAVDTTSAVDLTANPTSLAFDGVNLYVADAYDNRVLVFTPGDTPLPDSSIVNWASQIIRQEGVVSIGTPNVTANDTVTVTIAGTGYTYTVQKSDTPDTIAQGLVAAINKGAGDKNVVALFAGAGSGQVYLSSRGTNLAFDAISFSATTSNSANETVVASGSGYLTAGNAATGAPGMLVAINGTNLADLPPGQTATASLTGTIPTSLAGVQVFMDGIASPVFSVAANQVVSEIPFSFFGRNSTSIVVRTTHSNGSVTVTNASPIYIAQANPGIFDAPASPGQTPPYPATGVYHQAGNPQAVIDLTGAPNAGDVLTVKIANARSYSYTETSSDTLATIVSHLVAAINNGNDPDVTAQAGAAFDRVVVVARQGGAAGTGIAVSTSTSSSAQITMTAYTDTTCCNVVSGSAVTALNPAAPGETITISAAGLGVVTDLNGNRQVNIPVGQPFSGPQPNSAEASVSATMNGTTSQVVSAGLPTGAYGVYQVQLIVPTSQPTNAQTQVYLAQNAFISNTVTIPVGPANSNPNQPPVGTSPVTISIDTPAANGPALSGMSAVAGWAIDANTQITSVTVSVDGVQVTTAQYGGNRADVCAAHPSSASCANGNTGVGYNSLIDTTGFSDGTHMVEVTATDANGARLTVGKAFTTSNYRGPLPTAMSIDSPNNVNQVFQGMTTFYGWALNATTPITSLTYAIDGVSRGSIPYGTISRSDVCAAYPNSYPCSSGGNNVGWSFDFDTSAVNNGQHVISITATAANGQKVVGASGFTVANWTTGNPILMSIDKPNTQSGPLHGLQSVGGWILDPSAHILSVLLSVDGIPQGNATYNGARPDACVVNTGPDCPNVGFNGLIDTTLLTEGSHTLAVTAIPYSGQGVTRTMPIVVQNTQSGFNVSNVHIDKPNATSAPLSGLAGVGGWAYNGVAPVTTVEIFVDGVANGYAVYGGDRGDVCQVFGTQPGCPNVGWNYVLDTTALLNGPHQLEATITAENGDRATAGSSFVVANNVGPSPTTASIAQPSAQSGPYQGIAIFSGSAMSTRAPVTSIAISVDGYPYGQATYTPAGVNVPVNWTYRVNTVQFADGMHTVGVMVKAADGTYAMATAPLHIANWSASNPTIIAIDRPNAQTETFNGTGTFGGWILNPSSAIVSVTVAIDGVSYGTAAYGGNRPDACAGVPGAPGCPNVGWNFAFDTTLLSNGPHTASITATTAAGQTSTKSSGFTVVN